MHSPRVAGAVLLTRFVALGVCCTAIVLVAPGVAMSSPQKAVAALIAFAWVLVAILQHITAGGKMFRGPQAKS